MASEPETNRYAPPPGDFVREELKKRSWSQLDLAHIIGKPVTHVNQIILGNRAVSPDFAVALGLAFDTDPDVWLMREFRYRLFLKSQEAGHSLETNPEHGERQEAEAASRTRSHQGDAKERMDSDGK